MENIIVSIEKRIGSVQAGCAPTSRSHLCTALNDYDEKKRAFYIGKVAGYNIARAILTGAKSNIKEIMIVNAKVVTVRDYSYVAYLRTIKTLNSVIVETQKKINERNPVQSKRLLGQTLAISDIVNELKGFFLQSSMNFNV